MADNNTLDNKTKDLIYNQRIRCNLCHEIPIIKEIICSGGLSYFISAECLNKHGVFFCTIKDFCQDANQFEKLKCIKCGKYQGIVKTKQELFQYCQECKFLCPSCILSKHKKYKKKHPLIELQNLDYTCREHQMDYTCFCGECNINFCDLCIPNHKGHKNKHTLKNMMPDSKKLKDVEKKISEQKKIIEEINKCLDDILEAVNNKIKEFKDNLNNDLKLNLQIYNCVNGDKCNYQSILNFDKILDIDFSDISWIGEINNQLDKLIQIIKKNSPNKNTNISTTSNIIDKDLMEKFQEVMTADKNKTSIEELENRNRYDDFSNNELLKEIGTKNKKIYKKEEVIGNLKDIYILPQSKNYLILIDNGIFLFDQNTNELLCYIDINENLEYHDIICISHYYDRNFSKLLLFIGTKEIMKIYCIKEKEEYNCCLIQEIKIENIINFCVNDNSNLFVLSEAGYHIYESKNNIYELEIEYINVEKETCNLFYTNNYIIVGKKTKEELLFLDRNDFQIQFSIKNVLNNEKSRLLEINKDLICINYESIIQIIDIDRKCINDIYHKLKINNILSYEMINNKKMIISGNSEDKFSVYILEFNDSYKILKEKKNIENIKCNIVKQISNDKIILYTDYGINILEM